MAWQVLDELSPTKRSCLVVDATQSLGVVPIAVKSAGIDWLAPWMPWMPWDCENSRLVTRHLLEQR